MKQRERIYEISTDKTYEFIEIGNSQLFGLAEEVGSHMPTAENKMQLRHQRIQLSKANQTSLTSQHGTSVKFAWCKPCLAYDHNLCNNNERLDYSLPIDN